MPGFITEIRDVEVHDEKQSTSTEKDSIQTILYDQRGLPLVPQPSGFRDDPLVRLRFSTAKFYTQHECLPQTELAYMAEVGNPDSSGIYGLFRALQLRCH